MSSAGFQVYAEFVMSSFDSGSVPTTSTIAFTRRVMSVPTFTWAWRRTMSRAATRARGRLIGSFSRRWTIDWTSSAWNGVYADFPVAMAWDTTNGPASRFGAPPLTDHHVLGPLARSRHEQVEHLVLAGPLPRVGGLPAEPRAGQ